MGEIATVLIEEGIAEQFLAGHRREARERMALAQAVLGGIPMPACPTYHLWMPLPPPWRANEFAGEVRRRGVAISPADYFAIGRGPTPHAVRISLGGVREHRRLTAGLTVIAESLTTQPLAVNTAA
jgi:DNA-binding transcriptional MocR family regulator